MGPDRDVVVAVEDGIRASADLPAGPGPGELPIEDREETGQAPLAYSPTRPSASGGSTRSQPW
ncbi:MAG: hypothetical protein J0H06_08565 [Actinobacteria bacterium]|nr:hypothetical protein [Actinomycetota bacterium]